MGSPSGDFLNAVGDPTGDFLIPVGDLSGDWFPVASGDVRRLEDRCEVSDKSGSDFTSDDD